MASGGGCRALALAPGSALQVPYRSPTELRWSQQRGLLWPQPPAGCGRANSARREPGSRRCEVSQHDLSLRVCARQRANCSGAAKNSELRRAQDSLSPAAAGGDENGLTFAARRGSQRGAGRSRRGFWGSSGRGPCAMDAMHVGRQHCKGKNRWPNVQTSYDPPGCWRAKGADEAPPPRADWPAALPHSAPRYRSLLLPR